MAAEQFVDATCHGVELGKSLKLHDFGPTTAFLEVAAPMPVGSRVELRSDGGVKIDVEVVRVQEQVAGAETAPGMRVAATKLSGKAESWWSAQVSRTDPEIPEPARGTSAAAVADDAVPTATPTEVTIPSAGVPAPKDGKKPSARTQIMSVSEIQDAIAAGGQALEVSDGTPSAEMDAMPTDPVGADDGDGDGNGDGDGDAGASDAGDSASRRRGKKKRRRR